MFTHFTFSTKAISKALSYSNVTKISTIWTAHFIFLKTVLKHVVSKHKMIQGQLNGEKSQVWKNTQLFCCFAFGKETPIFIFQTHGCHDSLILKLQYFTVHRTISYNPQQITLNMRFMSYLDFYKLPVQVLKNPHFLSFKLIT